LIDAIPARMVMTWAIPAQMVPTQVVPLDGSAGGGIAAGHITQL
jgi:hypothetical protein